MGLGNRLVIAVLRSPMHRMLSGSTAVVRYIGPKSGRTISTPTQYAEHSGELIVLVGHPETKNWWRNFRSDRDLDVLVRRHWLPMRGRVVIGADEPEEIAPLLDAYLSRFPKAVRSLEGGTSEARSRDAVIVCCVPR